MISNIENASESLIDIESFWIVFLKNGFISYVRSDTIDKIYRHYGKANIENIIFEDSVIKSDDEMDNIF